MGFEQRSTTSSIDSRLAVDQIAVASTYHRVASMPHSVCELFIFRNHLGIECSISAFAILKLRLKASLYRRQQRIYHRPPPQY